MLTTAPSVADAHRLARGLVEGKLAACVNVIPDVQSFYAWKGALHHDAELQLVIKTRAARAADVERYLADNHPYEVPEILVLPIEGGSAKYLEWLDEQTS